MAIDIGRRQFISALGGAAIMWPIAGHTQKAAMPVIGILFDGLRVGLEPFLPAFRAGLNESGFVEGQNVAIEYRFAEGRYDRLPALAADLVGRHVDVVFAPAFAAVAAKTATSTIPIVFSTGMDPIRLGLVASLNRPGGNVIGTSFLSNSLTTKQIELLHKIVPNAATVGFLANPESVDANLQTRNAQAAARELGQTLSIVEARTKNDFETAFTMLVEQRAGALLVGGDPLFFSERDRIVELAARRAIPTMSFVREFAVSGGLASYGASVIEADLQAGRYVGRILKGEKPSDLPVMQPTKFELVINLKTAKTLGLEISPTLLAIVDEVIE